MPHTVMDKKCYITFLYETLWILHFKHYSTTCYFTAFVLKKFGTYVDNHCSDISVTF